MLLLYCSTLLDIFEKPELEADTLASKTLIQRWLKEESIPKEKRKYNIDKENFVYKIEEVENISGHISRKLKFKNQLEKVLLGLH